MVYTVVPGPVFKHDCQECSYQMTIQAPNGKQADLYLCPKSQISQVLARYGNEPSEYTTLAEQMGAILNNPSIPELPTLFPAPSES